jgi:hypothetical protein
MTEQEIKHIADRLGEVIVMVRTAELTPDQVAERLSYLQFLLDHPGWTKDRPVNLEDPMPRAEEYKRPWLPR